MSGTVETLPNRGTYRLRNMCSKSYPGISGCALSFFMFCISLLKLVRTPWIIPIPYLEGPSPIYIYMCNTLKLVPTVYSVNQIRKMIHLFGTLFNGLFFFFVIEAHIIAIWPGVAKF